jgi:uncharacterized protein YqgC (DUF456 family)
MAWVSRIFAATAAMILPGLAGQWCDKRWGLNFLGMAGFAIGLIAGIAYLLAVTKLPPKRPDQETHNGSRANHD